MPKTENKEKEVKTTKTVSKKPAAVKKVEKPAVEKVKDEAPKAVVKKVVKKTKPKAKTDSVFSCKDTTYSTGKRKTSVAKVWIKSGKGLFIVNNKDASEYFQGNKLFVEKTLRPFTITNSTQKFDVKCDVVGGGISAQSEAIMYGVAKGLLNIDSKFRTILKQHDLLTRDSRIVERKKYGKRKARRSAQFSKR